MLLNAYDKVMGCSHGQQCQTTQKRQWCHDKLTNSKINKVSTSSIREGERLEKATRGGEWEPIKKFQENSAYVLKSIQHRSSNSVKTA
jgi:hypothetical protein